MSQADFITDFTYGVAQDGAGLALGVSIFADRADVRLDLKDDAQAAGLAVRDCADLADLLDGPLRPLEQVVLVDCPAIDGAQLAALARLDERVARGGAQLIISTSMAALDGVFGCCDQSSPQILIDPSRGDRVIALGQVLARLPGLRVRELSEDDRLHLLRLTEQVGKIAERLDRLSPRTDTGRGGKTAETAFRLESPGSTFRADVPEVGDRLVRTARPPLPDPRLVRRVLRQRQLRARFFDSELFADPAWDMLLDLTAARAEHERVSVTSLCIASGVPCTTALRWISQMVRAGLLQRVEDDADRRRAFITLSDDAADAMARYFAEVGRAAEMLV